MSRSSKVVAYTLVVLGCMAVNSSYWTITAAPTQQESSCAWVNVGNGRSTLEAWDVASAVDTDRAVMYVLGGLDEKLDAVAKAETYDFSGAQSLSEVEIRGLANVPRALYGVAGAYRARGLESEESAVYWIGGSASVARGVGLNTILEYKPKSGEWTDLQVDGNEKLKNRYWAAAEYDPIADVIWIVGGTGRCDLANRDASPCRPGAIDTVYLAWDARGKPSLHVLGGAASKKSIIGHELVYDPLNERMLLLGGSNNLLNASDDVEELILDEDPSNARFAPFAALGTPVELAWHGSAFWPGRQLLFLAGGASRNLFDYDRSVRGQESANTKGWLVGPDGTEEWRTLADDPGDQIGGAFEFVRNDLGLETVVVSAGRRVLKAPLFDGMGKPSKGRDAATTIGQVKALSCDEAMPTTTPTSTNTPVPTATTLATPIPSQTPVPTAGMSTLEPTETATATSTHETPVPTSTVAMTATATATQLKEDTVTPRPVALYLPALYRDHFKVEVWNAPERGRTRMAACGHYLFVSSGTRVYRLKLPRLTDTASHDSGTPHAVILDVAPIGDDSCDEVLAAVWSEGLVHFKAVGRDLLEDVRYDDAPLRYVYQLDEYRGMHFAGASAETGARGGVFYADVSGEQADWRSWGLRGEGLTPLSLLVVGPEASGASARVYAGTTDSVWSATREGIWEQESLFNGAEVWSLLNNVWSARDEDRMRLHVVGVLNNGLWIADDLGWRPSPNDPFVGTTVTSLTSGRLSSGQQVVLAASRTKGVRYQLGDGEWRELVIPRGNRPPERTYQAVVHTVQNQDYLIIATDDGVIAYPDAASLMPALDVGE